MIIENKGLMIIFQKQEEMKIIIITKYSAFSNFKNYTNNKNRNKKINKIPLKNRRKNNINIKIENEINENNNMKIVNKIKINKACLYFCFFYARKRKNLDNLLLDEGINIIYEKLDVLNVFDKIYKVDQTLEKVEENELFEVMSNECKIKLLSINNNYK